MCGHRVQLHRDRGGKTYYVCAKPQEGERRRCDGLIKQCAPVETAVATMIGEIATAPRLREMIRTEASEQLGTLRGELEERHGALTGRIEHLDGQLIQSAEQLNRGVMSAAAFARVDARWQQQLSEAQEELDEVERRPEQGDVEIAGGWIR